MGPKKGRKKDSSSSQSSDSEEDSSSTTSSEESGKKQTSKHHSKSTKNTKRKKVHSDSEPDENSRKKTKTAMPEEKCEDKKYLPEKRSHKERSPDFEKYDRKSNYSKKHESRDYERVYDKRNNYDRSREKRDNYYDNRKKGDERHSDYREKYDRGYERDKYDNRDSRSHGGNYEKHRNRPIRNDYNRRDKRDDRRSPSFDHANAKWGKSDEKSAKVEKETLQKEKPNFGLSGKLTEETNTYRGVVIKYSEPPEARKPRRRWRLYPFKGEKALQTLYIHRESAYLIGRDRKVVDLPVDHPSCSKQHAALQYRLVPFTREDGTGGKRVRPYLIDLESANGTFINNKKIEPKKYVELLEKDVIKFGFSSREYVLLHENSKDEAMDDDVKQEEEEAVKQEVKDEPN